MKSCEYRHLSIKTNSFLYWYLSQKIYIIYKYHKRCFFIIWFFLLMFGIKILFLILCLWFLFFIIYIWFLFFANMWKNRKLPPYVNSFDRQLKLLDKSHFAAWANILDLWCGDGKALRYIIKNFGLLQWVGYDINNFAIKLGKIYNKLLRLSDQITLIKDNIYNADLKWFEYVYIYLFPDFMEEMEDRLRNGLDQWTMIYANTFAFAKHEPIDVIKNANGKVVWRIYKVLKD